MYNSGMRRINVSQARQTLPAQLDRVAAGEEVSITRHGRVVAVLVRPDVLASRRASAAWDRSAHVAALLETARTQPVRTAAIDDERAGQLAEAARASRSGR
ncbi:type II toxin-antitoxin system Phd/YefM family antitoxin [Homoserinibacter gongjuensis]|jgi:antitoxin (DNA-binding transcriptional repressor) of toxin-antitoxin stability system